MGIFVTVHAMMMSLWLGVFGQPDGYWDGRWWSLANSTPVTAIGTATYHSESLGFNLADYFQASCRYFRNSLPGDGEIDQADVVANAPLGYEPKGPWVATVSGDSLVVTMTGPAPVGASLVSIAYGAAEALGFPSGVGVSTGDAIAPMALAGGPLVNSDGSLTGSSLLPAASEEVALPIPVTSDLPVLICLR